MSKCKSSSKHLFWMAPLIIFMFILGAVGSTFAAIAVDGTATNSSSTTSTVSWSHTVGTGSNRLLVVGVSFDARNSNTVSSVTYGGTALTNLRAEGTGANFARTEIWYLTAPASGSNTITVTIGGTATDKLNMAGAVSYTGVDQTTPFSSNRGAAGTTASAPSVSISSATGNLIFDIFATYRPTTTPSQGAGQTLYWKNTTQGTTGVNGGMSSKAGTSATTMSWTGRATTGTGNVWSISAASIKAAIVDTTAPSSSVTSPANGAKLNSTSANPYTISGSATDNSAVSSIDVSTDGGTTWNAATCTGCPGASVTWSYSWTLPVDGTYSIKSRAKDTSNNTQTPGSGNTVTIDRVAPSVSSTIPVNGATGVTLNSNVTINWSENIDCTTVNTTNITSTSSGWTLSNCTANQAVFTTSGQTNLTSYTVTVSTAVKDTAGNAMTANYSFSFTTVAPVVCTDADGDGYGANGASTCPNGTAIDCNDNNVNIHPNALDNTCNGVDENCSSIADEGYVPTATSCGLGVCATTGQNICQNGAIVDTCTPGAPQTEGPYNSPTCSDTIDNNCNGLTDTADSSCAVPACIDADGDGYGTNGSPLCANGTTLDCNDNDNTVYPGAPLLCDGKDNNCDDRKDFTTDEDKDLDGVFWCANDCNDNDAARFPGNPEICDGKDNDCVSGIPANEIDNDGDTYLLCSVPPDCNNTDASMNPGSPELCGDNKDNNCNGQVDEAGCICPDTDADGQTSSVCGGTDCNDSDNTVYVGAPELCTDGKDNNCNGIVDIQDPVATGCPAYCVDTDGDNYFVGGAGCGTVDCDDTDANVYPGAATICDGKDSNCDGREDFSTDKDMDNDGVLWCAGDCDDNNPSRFPGNPEICDGIDNDCAGGVPGAEADLDNDTYLACGSPADCNDTDPNINPGIQEYC
ncbi:MAG: Ig-like domain-containing protein, partial [Nitrospirae bacterium]|nr:Ig-like domain-containing protein [Nitrospirota bacterium]